jgi:hypothetical protein
MVYCVGPPDRDLRPRSLHYSLDGKFAGILLLLCGAIAAYGKFLPGSFDTTALRSSPPFLPCSVALGQGLSLCPSGS